MPPSLFLSPPIFSLCSLHRLLFSTFAGFALPLDFSSSNPQGFRNACRRFLLPSAVYGKFFCCAERGSDRVYRTASGLLLNISCKKEKTREEEMASAMEKGVCSGPGIAKPDRAPLECCSPSDSSEQLLFIIRPTSNRSPQIYISMDAALREPGEPLYLPTAQLYDKDCTLVSVSASAIRQRPPVRIIPIYARSWELL